MVAPAGLCPVPWNDLSPQGSPFLDRLLTAIFASILLTLSGGVHAAVLASPAHAPGAKIQAALVSKSSRAPQAVAPELAAPLSARSSSETANAGTGAVLGFRSEENIYNRRGYWQRDVTRGKSERIDRGPVPRLSALIPILMYHNVRPIDFKSTNAFVSSLTLPPTELERHVRYLKQRGFTSVTLRAVGDYLKGQGELPAKPVVLTFDDGFENNYQYALPILKAEGFTGTFFIITGLVGHNEYMDWGQVAELSKAGMEIGSHTINHPDLAKSLPVLRDRELVQSKQTLEEKLGVTVDTLSYPGGAYNDDVAASARKIGYGVAVTTQYGATQYGAKPMELSRIRVQGTDELGAFKWKIEQYFPVGDPAKS